ncbi:MAG: 30S ribosomal protein S3 [Bryobacterales bacterium]|nr:30S ribosomal protein S3 [Bryobacterales bacterium]MDE0625489.1 30S ribosomal protein S3 [Bryobacterales bacterium]
MGQKVHPYGFRLGYTKVWRSRWYAQKGYADLMNEDIDLKEDLRRRLKPAGISSIELDRPGNKLRIAIRTARPGIIIGKRGSEIEKLKAELQRRTRRDIYIDIQEVHRPELDAQLVSESVAMQIEKRVNFRRAMRKAVDFAQRFGCKGIKIWVAGRLNGKMIARSEWHLRGRLPLQTLRADIDFGFTEAHTTYGVLGVKCWIYKGEIIDPRGVAIRRTGREEPEPARRREARSQAQRERERLRPPPVAAPTSRPGPQPAPQAPPRRGEPTFRPPLAGSAAGQKEEK